MPPGTAAMSTTSQTSNAAVGVSVCMLPASTAVSGRLAYSATAAQLARASPPSVRPRRHTPAAVSRIHSALTGPRDSSPAMTCGNDCSTSPSHGARAQMWVSGIHRIATLLQQLPWQAQVIAQVVHLQGRQPASGAGQAQCEHREAAARGAEATASRHCVLSACTEASSDSRRSASSRMQIAR